MAVQNRSQTGMVTLPPKKAPAVTTAFGQGREAMNGTPSFFKSESERATSQLLVHLSVALCIYLLTVSLVHVARKGRANRLYLVNLLITITCAIELVDSSLLNLQLVLTYEQYVVACKFKMIAHVAMGLSLRCIITVVIYQQASAFATGRFQTDAGWHFRIKVFICGIAVLGTVLLSSMTFIWVSAADGDCVQGTTTIIALVVTLGCFGGIIMCRLGVLCSIMQPIVQAWLEKRKSTASYTVRTTNMLRDVYTRMAVGSCIIVLTDISIITVCGLINEALSLPFIVVFHYNIHLSVVALHIIHNDYRERLFPWIVFLDRLTRRQESSDTTSTGDGKKTTATEETN